MACHLWNVTQPAGPEAPGSNDYSSSHSPKAKVSPGSLVDAVLPLASSPVLSTAEVEMEVIGEVQRPGWRWREKFAYAV